MDSVAILAYAGRVAYEAWPLALAWHGVAVAMIVAAALGWRASNQSVGLWLSVMLISVACVAFTFANAFNGVVFLASAICLGVLVFSSKASSNSARMISAPLRILAVALIAFGWVYPHFDLPGSMYLIAAPMGTLPCPTLATVVGVTLLFRGLENRPFCFVLVGLTVFYGIVGVFVLRVWLDVGLLIAAGSLLSICAKKPTKEEMIWKINPPQLRPPAKTAISSSN